MVQVRASGYSEEDMLEEVQNMASGQSWVYNPPRTDPGGDMPMHSPHALLAGRL